MGVLGVAVVDPVGELVLGVSLEIVLMMAVLVFPADLLVVAYHRSVEVLERVRVSTSVSTPVTTSVAIATTVTTAVSASFRYARVFAIWNRCFD